MMKLLICSLLTSCLSFNALAADNPKENDYVDGEITASSLTAAKSEINDYLMDLTRENPPLGKVMTDVVKVKRDQCQLDMGIQDIKLIANKDDVFKELEDEVSRNPTFTKSFAYSSRIKRHFGKCF
ncbi:hypothetical protein ACI0X9_003945 [Cronobacter turicensis]